MTMQATARTPRPVSPLGAALPLLAAAALLSACGQPVLLEELAPDSSCRRIEMVGTPGVPADSAAIQRLTVHWVLPEQTDQLHRLNAWCAAVGPAVVGGWAPTPDPIVPPLADSASADSTPADSPVVGGASTDSASADSDGGVRRRRRGVDSVAVVSWNVHVGGGALRTLVRDLRAGTLTDGRPVEHFVLLLQETYRGGAAVPPFDADLPGGSAVDVAPPGGLREDIVRDAEALGLDLFYAPSMRSGEGEDRGNAILSTLPLRDLVAIPLPVARQRRVAIAATIADSTTEGVPWLLQVASVHLESDAEGLASDERARLLQTEALLDALPPAEVAVAGGDFNTRPRGPESALVRTMLAAYPDTPPFPAGPTYRRAWGLYRLYLDYIFMRLPPEARGSARRVPGLYGSDHYPLVGWVVLR